MRTSFSDVAYIFRKLNVVGHVYCELWNHLLFGIVKLSEGGCAIMVGEFQSVRKPDIQKPLKGPYGEVQYLSKTIKWG